MWYSWIHTEQTETSLFAWLNQQRLQEAIKRCPEEDTPPQTLISHFRAKLFQCSTFKEMNEGAAYLHALLGSV